MKLKSLISLALFFLLNSSQAQVKTLLFAGSYTGGKPDKGIYVFQFDTKTGKLNPVSNAENVINPSFITLSPNGQYLYACSETSLPTEGSISAFKIEAGKLTFINKQPSGGENPAHLTTDKSGKYVIAGNYSGGSVVVMTTNEDGSLNPYNQLIKFEDSSINKERQEKSHIHQVVFSPQQNFVFLPDLGADKIRAFRFDSKNTKPLVSADDLTVKTTLGSGPRHFTFHPNQKYGYCIEELSGTVSAYSYKNGKLSNFQKIFSCSKIKETYSCADIHISPDGLFLYASNRGDGENTISIFSIDQTNGKLKLLGHESTCGEKPRNFTIDPSGQFLLVANQTTSNVVVFRRNKKTGLLTKLKDEINVPSVSCLQMRIY